MDLLRTITREGAIAASARIDGWLAPDEAGHLFDLAKAAEGPIVEIGAHLGRSTVALALGSLADGRKPVVVVDPFVGGNDGDCNTDLGVPAKESRSSPAILTANLIAAGAAEVVRILPGKAADVAGQAPASIGLLFIDGAHDYESVAADCRAYLPRVAIGGRVVFHDVTLQNPGVVQAFDEHITSRPLEWLLSGRCGSTCTAIRRPATRTTIGLGLPGPSWTFAAVKGITTASLGAYATELIHSGIGWDDMEHIWAAALNLAEAGAITHFAMLHSDIGPDPGWLDTLMWEVDRLGADMVSAAVPIKDDRGVLSCGIGNLGNTWGAWRRFTLTELHGLPQTFSLADTIYADRQDLYLLHNSGCFVADLRRPAWKSVDERGELVAHFPFPTRVIKTDAGKWQAQRESEDWHFSRGVHRLGLRSYITRKVGLAHYGNWGFVNGRPWGRYKADEDSRKTWEPAR